MVRPRYLVWENVVGAFSSNKGKDFAAVLEEIIKIVEPEAPGIEVPEKGWPTWGGYHDEVGGRWSVVWRTHDAQYWGVPQRRRRISVVADFGGDTASEIQFDRKSVSGDIAEGGTAGEGSAEAAETSTSYAVRIRGGCDGGGKGALVQTERSGTLGTGNDQTIFCMATQQGGAEIRTDDGAPTLTAAAGMSGNNQQVVCMTPWDCQSKRIFDTNGSSHTLQGGVGGGVNNPAVMCMTPWDAQSQRVYDGDGISPTLSSRENSGLNREAVLCARFKLGNSEQARSIGYEEEKAPTLNAECGGNKPAVVAPTCLDMSHACDVIRDCGEQAPALQARMGTGGNQIPLTYQDVAGTLSPGAHAGSYNGQDAYNDMLVFGAENPDVSKTLRAKANCAYREDAETYPVQNMVVRRLTPLECTRLQGYPDHWVDIGDWVDENGKKHKDADSPKYKALGNSIALPFWEWMLRRMARYLPEGATLGSLFDGIGGFPLAFERIHGRGTARWASEIEPFPIAVTKKRFGEE